MIRCVEAFRCQDQHGQLSASIGRARASLAEDGETAMWRTHSRGVWDWSVGPVESQGRRVFFTAMKGLDNTIQLLPVSQVAQKSPVAF